MSNHRITMDREAQRVLASCEALSTLRTMGASLELVPAFGQPLPADQWDTGMTYGPKAA